MHISSNIGSHCVICNRKQPSKGDHRPYLHIVMVISWLPFFLNKKLRIKQKLIFHSRFKLCVGWVMKRKKCFLTQSFVVIFSYDILFVYHHSKKLSICIRILIILSRIIIFQTNDLKDKQHKTNIKISIPILRLIQKSI